MYSFTIFFRDGIYYQTDINLLCERKTRFIGHNVAVIIEMFQILYSFLFSKIFIFLCFILAVMNKNNSTKLAGWAVQITI